MNRYTSVPSAIQTIHVSVVGDKALLSITLPKEAKEGLLYEFQTVECSYKKNSFLAQSKQITIDLKSQPALENIVNIQLTDLAPSTVYQCKVRLANRNGFGSWSKNMEISIKESESESDSDSDSTDSTSEEEKEEVKKPSMRDKAKQLASSATSPIKQLASSLPTPIKQLSSSSSSSSTKQQPSSKRSPSPKPVEEKPTEVVTPVVPQETPITPPKEQPPTPEEILHWVEEGKLDKLSQLPVSSLSSLHSPVFYSSLLIH